MAVPIAIGIIGGVFFLLLSFAQAKESKKAND